MRIARLPLGWIHIAGAGVLLLLMYFSSSAQRPLEIKLYSTDQGLSQRDVFYVTRDDRGFMWIINSDIDFYDGQAITRYSKFDSTHYIPITGIISAARVRDSLLVFTDMKDLVALNINSGEIQSMDYPPGMAPGFPGNSTIMDRQHHPDLLVFTRNEDLTMIHVIDRDWKYQFGYTVRRDESIFIKLMRCYANGPEGVLWLMDEDLNQVLRMTKEGKSVIPFNFERPFPWIQYRISYHPEFGLLIIRNNGKVYAISKDGKHQRELRTISLDKNNMKLIHISPDGQVWVICTDRIVRFRGETGPEEVFDVIPFGHFAPTIHNSYEDQEGILWISTEIGLVQINNRPKSFVPFYRQPDNMVNLQTREILPIGHSRAFARVFQEERDMLLLSFDDQFHCDSIHISGQIRNSGRFNLVGDQLCYIPDGEKDMTLYDIRTGQTRHFVLPVNTALTYFNQFIALNDSTILYQDQDNNLIELNCYTGRYGLHKLEHIDSLVNSAWRAIICTPDRKAIIASVANGITIYDLRLNRLIRHYSSATLPAISGNNVNVLRLQQDSILWAGTLGAGLNRISLTSNKVQYYTTHQGLPNNMIASLVEDLSGNIWIGTFGGLSMFDTEESRFYNYYVEDGLSNNEFNYLSATRLGDGRILMGTINGMTLFNPEDVIGKKALPPVELTAVRKYNRRTDKLTLEERYLDRLKYIDISPYDNYVELQFAVPSFQSNTSHTFMAKLEGVDKDWQDLRHNHSIRFQKLPAGYYTLELMASDASGNKTSRPTIIKLYVRQIFYRSAWFITLMVLVLFGGVFWFYRYRLSMIKKEHLTRTRIASDLHDEVGGTLTGLSLQLQMMELSSDPEQQSYLQRVSAVINESITKMRDLVWSIDARSDHWGNVLERMQDFAADTLFAKDIAFSLVHDGIQTGESVDARMKHNLYLIYKEAIHNAAKHSQADKVNAELHQSDKTIVLRVKDNGKPRERVRMEKGQGLLNMQLRAERLGGKLSTGYTEEGYTVELVVPRSN